MSNRTEQYSASGVSKIVFQLHISSSQLNTMHHWSRSEPSAGSIIKLIEEKERKEMKYNNPYENESGNWNIVSYKEPVERSGRVRSIRDVEQESSTSQWRDDREQPDPRIRESYERRTEVVPVSRWGPKIEESLSKQLRAEIDVEWRVRKRSNTPDERVDARSKRQHPTSEKLQYEPIVQKRIRSRSPSVDRKRERRSRSKSNSRVTKTVRSYRRKSRSRSRSRDGNRKRSGSQERRRDRSDSRGRKRQRNSSKERRDDRSDRHRSRSRDTEKRRRSPTPKAENSTTAAETADILSKFVSMIKEVKEQPAQIAPNYDVLLPEFDSSNNGHTILAWLYRVEDIAKLFGWGEKETIQFALPKLVGEAKTWYQSLETVPYSWCDWRKKLKEQFKCPNFGRLVAEMTQRHAVPPESLETYYYDKIVLVNRCGFKGRYAVDCILSGIKVESIRLCAQAADFAEPEELLKYLKSVETLWLEKKNTQNKQTADKSTKAELAAKSNLALVTLCFYCGKKGHKSNVCKFKKADSVLANTIKPGKIPKKFKPHHKVQFLPPQFDPLQQYQPPQFEPPQQYQPPQQFQHPQQFQQTAKKTKLCFNCREVGHLAKHCQLPKKDPPSNGAPGYKEPGPPGLEGEED